MNSLIFDKPYNELTAKEAKREVLLQRWLLRMMRTFGKHSEYKRQKQIDKRSLDGDLLEEYLNGFITAETYKQRKAHDGTHLYYATVWQDRQNFCERMSKLLEGEIALLNDMLVNSELYKPPGKKRGRPRKEPKTRKVGYDPRRNRSIYNQPKKRNCE